MPREVFVTAARFALPVLLVACLQTSPAAAVEPTAAGLHDIVVFDPGAHERGLPAVELDPHGKGLKVEIPPAVHVHRYYYSGDKEIQGPIITGGPTVVVASHPKTGEKMYIDVVLPAGAPRIAYNKHSITYVYPHQRVEVKFQSWPFDSRKAVVKHHSGKGFSRKIHDAHQHVKQHVHDHFSESQVAQSVKQASSNAGELAKGAGETFGSLAKQGVDGIDSLISAIPGVNYLRSRADQQGERQRLTELQEADRLKQLNAPQFQPTNR